MPKIEKIERLLEYLMDCKVEVDIQFTVDYGARARAHWSGSGIQVKFSPRLLSLVYTGLSFFRGLCLNSLSRPAHAVVHLTCSLDTQQTRTQPIYKRPEQTKQRFSGQRSQIDLERFLCTISPFLSSTERDIRRCPDSASSSGQGDSETPLVIKDFRERVIWSGERYRCHLDRPLIRISTGLVEPSWVAFSTSRLLEVSSHSESSSSASEDGISQLSSVPALLKSLVGVDFNLISTLTVVELSPNPILQNHKSCHNS